MEFSTGIAGHGRKRSVGWIFLCLLSTIYTRGFLAIHRPLAGRGVTSLGEGYARRRDQEDH